jgi:YHS domain-containing protein
MQASKGYARSLLAVLSAIAVGIFCVAAPASAQTRQRVALNDMGYMADGYDTVAYFTQSKAVKGDPRYTVEHSGAKFMFASQQDMDLFKANPAQYTPQYGGHCSTNMAQGKLVKGDPQQFFIHEGRLYLQASDAGNTAFRQKPAELVRMAETNWKNLNQGG